MAEFRYRAASPAGVLLEGDCDAASVEAAVRNLRARGLTPILVEPMEAPRPQTGALSLGSRKQGRGVFRRAGRIGAADVLAISTELSVMLRAGLSLDGALRVLIDMSHGPATTALLQDILERVKEGSTLSAALTAHHGLFGDFYINMVRSGEAGGNLSDVLARLVEHLERMRSLRESVVSATIYPSILLVVAVLSLVVMLGFVVPQFESMFSDLGDALPLPTRLVLEAGDWFKHYGLYAAVLALLGGAVLSQLGRSPAGQARLQGLALRVPVLGGVLRKYDITRFVRSFGTLLGNGVPILVALDIARQTVGNLQFRQILARVTPAMKSGGKLTDALGATGFFEPMALNLIKVGEETGRLDVMLLELARLFDRDVETSIKRALTMLEPILILTLGLLIAVIIVSILMGILSVNDLAL